MSNLHAVFVSRPHRSLLALDSVWMRGALMVALCLALLSLVNARILLAQEVSTADALFRSAHAAADEGKWELACQRFAESHRLDASAGAALNLARCSEKLSKWTSAWNYYVEVVESLNTNDERALYAQKKANELELVLPRLVLRVPQGFPDNAEVRVQGMRLSSASFNIALPFDPGPVEILVTLAGHRPSRSLAQVVKSETVELVLQVGEVQAIEQGAVPTNSSGAERARSWRTPTALAFGGAGIGVGVAGTVWTLIEANKVKQNCGEFCNSEGINATKRGKSAVVLMASGYALGAIALALGWHWWTVDHEKPEILSLRPHGLVPMTGGARFLLESHF